MDTRVEKLAAREQQRRGFSVSYAKDYAQRTISRVEAAGLVVFDPAVDDATIDRLANLSHAAVCGCDLAADASDHNGVRAVLKALATKP
jgi:hypothetical protein